MISPPGYVVLLSNILLPNRIGLRAAVCYFHWATNTKKLTGKLSDDEQQFKNLMEKYVFSDKEPLNDDVLDCLEQRPSVLQAHGIANRIIQKMKEYFEVFIKGMVG